MKGNFKRIMSIMLAAVVAFGMLGVSTASTYAASQKWTIGTPDLLWQGESGYVVSVYDMNSEGLKEAKVTKVTSDNKDVIKVTKSKYMGVTDYCLGTVGPGTAKITVDFKTPAGKAKTKTKTIVVKEYPNHLKSIKVNGKSVKISENKFDLYKRTSKTSVKIKMALQNGWKIRSIYAYRATKAGKTSSFKVTKKTIKNGSEIKFPKKYSDMGIDVYMYKGDDEIRYYFGFYRP